MPLTNAQINTLRAFVTASVDAAIVAARTAGNTVDLAVALNATAAGPVKAWNPNVTPRLADEATPWAKFDTLDSQAQGGKKLSWMSFFNYARDASRGPMRRWVTDVWGAATASSDAESILTAFLIDATVAQAAIGGNVATTGTVAALNLRYTDSVTQDEAQRILRSA